MVMRKITNGSLTVIEGVFEGRKEMFYLTIYLRLYGIRQMVKD